ncbi:MAG TPA: CcmD family protein [Ferruginibacter sp.]|nr:CcmD family protein [Chitinophagaceae bacterium]HRI24750.1 CcmD family protein [Ferruginibacter sp.]
MNKFILRSLFCILGMLLSATGFAQDAGASADLMRSNGKIYVVVAVCLTILLGLFLYVFSIDRKISRLEKNKD